MIDDKVAVFFKRLNATIPLTSILANEYPSSNETSKKNGTVRGDCIACDALLNRGSLQLISCSNGEHSNARWWRHGERPGVLGVELPVLHIEKL